MTRLGLAVYLALAFLVALVSAKVRVPVSYFWKFSHPYVDGYWEQLYRLRDKSGGYFRVARQLDRMPQDLRLGARPHLLFIF